MLQIPDTELESELVQATEIAAAPVERILLHPHPTPARTGRGHGVLALGGDVPLVCSRALASPYLAIDFETRGGDTSDDSIAVVGLGLAWDTGSCYFDWENLETAQRDQLRDLLAEHPALVAHNIYFDGAVAFRLLEGVHPHWAACTYALFAFLSNESPQIRWGLKSIQTDILLWETSNEVLLDEWLVSHGFYRGGHRDGDGAQLVEMYRAGGLAPNKAEMHRAPAEVLGPYCILDAESCYLLFLHHILPVLQRFPGLQDFWADFLYSIRLHVEQHLSGIPADHAGLQVRAEVLQAEIQRISGQLESVPEVAEYLSVARQQLLSGLAAKEPNQFRALKPRAPEPPQFRKDGEISKIWLRWAEQGEREPKVSTLWKNWNERWKAAQSGTDPEYHFNWQSNLQLCDLLYGHLGNPVVLRTDAGSPAVSIKALRRMGEVGDLLIQRAWSEKELGYIADYVVRTTTRPTIHPSYRMPGTVTGRLSSKQPNLQQVPKTRAVMSLFHARPGCVWVDLDFAALEAVVVTEFSQDPNMLLLYGDNVPPNDIHLFLAAHTPGLREAVLAAGYDPQRPTAEGVAAAKKLAKRQRSIAKTCVYACQYGAGVRKLAETLSNEGVEIELSEVETLHGTYWELFSGIKRFGRELEYQWRANGGWVSSGLYARPLCVPQDYRKDVLSRFIQSTGHDILVRYIRLYTTELTRLGIPWTPLILDLHDATTVEVPQECAESAVAVMRDSLVELNSQLGGTIQLSGTPVVGRNLAEVKEAED